MSVFRVIGLAFGLALGVPSPVSGQDASAPAQFAPSVRFDLLAIDARAGRATVRLGSGAIEVLGRLQSTHDGLVTLRAVDDEAALLEVLDRTSGERAIYRVARGQSVSATLERPGAGQSVVGIPLKAHSAPAENAASPEQGQGP